MDLLFADVGECGRRLRGGLLGSSDGIFIVRIIDFDSCPSLMSLLRDIDHFVGFELVRHSELRALAADLAFTDLISLERFAFDRYLTIVR